MGLYLGIDGGGSTTVCGLGDESNLLATSVAAGSNLVRTGEKPPREALHAAIRKVCETAKITPEEISGTCAGVAGAARPEIKETIQRMLAELLPGKIEVVGDMEISLEAAFGEGQGVIVISGTGSIAFGRDAQGRTARAGGWGFAASDEGSGYWIGRRTNAALLRARDECASNPLMEIIRKEWGVGTDEQFILTLNATPPPHFAELFPAVAAAAESGDPLASGVLREAGVELAALAKIVVRRLFPDAVAAVAISGGVFQHSSIVRESFSQELRANVPNAVVNLEVVNPVEGALSRARRLFR
jgi:N-acetylglucosamine kinase-like BadF-type ATPase